MKTLIIAATAALIAAPALATDISAADFAAQHFAQSHSEGDGPRGSSLSANDGIRIATSNGISDASAFAYEHFAQDRETGDGPRVRLEDTGVVVSTKGGDIAVAAAAHLANGPEDKR